MRSCRGPQPWCPRGRLGCRPPGRDTVRSCIACMLHPHTPGSCAGCGRPAPSPVQRLGRWVSFARPLCHNIEQPKTDRQPARNRPALSKNAFKRTNVAPQRTLSCPISRQEACFSDVRQKTHTQNNAHAHSLPWVWPITPASRSPRITKDSLS